MSDEGGAGMSNDENFLSRWSRRKIEAREAVPLPDAAGPAPAAVGEARAVPEAPQADAPAAAELPAVDTLHGLEGEYSGFLKPEVDDVLRRSALKKLFADPHFNVIDVNEAYSGDWASSTPIPAAVLATIEHAKHLLVDPDDEKQKNVKPADADPRDDAERDAGYREAVESAPDEAANIAPADATNELHPMPGAVPASSEKA